MMQRRHAIQYKTKVLSTPISETIELFRFKSNRNENYKKKRILVRVSSNNRVSLDDGKTEKKS